MTTDLLKQLEEKAHQIRRQLGTAYACDHHRTAARLETQLTQTEQRIDQLHTRRNPR